MNSIYLFEPCVCGATDCLFCFPSRNMANAYYDPEDPDPAPDEDEEEDEE